MRRSSPFADPAWAQASENMARIIAGNPEGKAEYEAALTQVKSQQQADRFARQANRSINSAADAIELGDPQRVVADLVRSGDNYGDIGGVLQAFGGARRADGEITSDQLRAYMAGAGNAGDADTALTYSEQNQISRRNAAESQRESVATQAMRNRGTLEGAAVQDTPAGLLQDPEVVRSLATALNAYQMDPENVVAGDMMTGSVGREEGVRMVDPLSADESLATALSDDPAALANHRYGRGPNAPVTTDEYTAQQAAAEGLSADETERLGENLSIDEALSQDYQTGGLTIGDIGKYRYGHGWPNDLDTGGGSGSGNGSGEEGGYDMLDQTRISSLQGELDGAISNYLVDRGAPVTEDSDGDPILDYGAIPPELVPSVKKMAADAMQRDFDARRGMAPAEHYVQEAARTLGVSVDPATGGDDWIPFNETPASVNMRTPTPGAPVQQQTQSTDDGGGPSPGQVEDGFRFLGGDPGDPNNWQQVQ